MTHPLVTGNPPAWASGWGQDRFGVFVEFTVRDIVQRLRWVPPGRFWMGSPEDEAGRHDDEGPRHEVTLSAGFWLADTPCTQELWQAVMDENPSQFVSPRRPVERVSWERVVDDFLPRLNDACEGLVGGLPTEAQWEYACRAGTSTATYAGEMPIEDGKTAPILDAIAWYRGNSGTDFDLDGDRGTRMVGEKLPNDLGLYDMLGNVYEWCRDGRRDYRADATIDPVGSEEEGALRVIRGGSWGDVARFVRAASRYWYHPGYAFDFLGFRLSRGQESAPGGAGGAGGVSG